MDELTTIGLDLAKHVFHVVGSDARGKVLFRKVLRRGQVRRYFANVPSCVVGMEGCASAHFWARELRAFGHEVRLIPAQHVKAYVRGNKNDYNDARAIAEAAGRSDIRAVSVKTVEQQDVQALYRLRAARVKERTALCNQVRGLLGEYGIVLAQGVGTVRRRVPEVLEDAESGVSDFLRPLLRRCHEQLSELDGHIEFYTRALHEHARRDEAVQRLRHSGNGTGGGEHAFVGDVEAILSPRDATCRRRWDRRLRHQQARGPVLGSLLVRSAFGSQARPPAPGPAQSLGPGGADQTSSTVALANKTDGRFEHRYRPACGPQISTPCPPPRQCSRHARRGAWISAPPATTALGAQLARPHDPPADPELSLTNRGIAKALGPAMTKQVRPAHRKPG